MATEKDDIVTFLNSAGEEISNDPRWLAKKNLANSGTDVDALQAENEALKARLAALEAGATDDSAGVDEDEAQKDDGDDYDKLDGKALKALAGERGVDIKGMTKVSEVRAALREADKA